LRAFVDEGATIVTQEANADFFAKALSAPRTLNPDRLARSQKKPVIESVGEKKVLSDGSRTLELHHIRDNPHHDGLLLAFLPKEKMVIEADVFTSGAGDPNAVNPASVNIVDNVERLKLDYDTVLPLHGPAAASRAELYTAIRKPLRDMNEILSAQAPPAAGQRGQAAAVPAGKSILDRACTACHNLSRVENKKLNDADWRTIVLRMQERGAAITDTDVDSLVDYLVKTYGAQ
jgi:cytochrome c5